MTLTNHRNVVPSPSPVSSIVGEANSHGWYQSDRLCHKCKAAYLIIRDLDNDHDDEQWKCLHCGANGYFEGADA